MRHLHPAAWAGLMLNGMLTSMLFSGLDGFVPADAPALEQTLLRALEILRPAMLLLLGLQAVALGLIASRYKAGMALAAVTSFFMMPSGLVYLVGCILSHYRWKYSGFESTTSYGRIEASFPSAAAVTLPRLTIGAFVLSALGFSAGLSDLGVVFLGLGLAGVYLSLRAKKFYALSIHQGHFTVTPGLFVDPLLISYSSVREATLYDDESIHFTIEPREGPPLALVWSLLRVEKGKRRAALEGLGAVLASHQVPLS